MVSVCNSGTAEFVINPVDRVAQTVFVQVGFDGVEDFTATARGTGAFGSSGRR